MHGPALSTASGSRFARRSSRRASPGRNTGVAHLSTANGVFFSCRAAARGQLPLSSDARCISHCHRERELKNGGGQQQRSACVRAGDHDRLPSPLRGGSPECAGGPIATSGPTMGPLASRGRFDALSVCRGRSERLRGRQWARSVIGTHVSPSDHNGRRAGGQEQLVVTVPLPPLTPDRKQLRRRLQRLA